MCSIGIYLFSQNNLNNYNTVAYMYLMDSIGKYTIVYSCDVAYILFFIYFFKVFYLFIF